MKLSSEPDYVPDKYTVVFAPPSLNTMRPALRGNDYRFTEALWPPQSN